MPNLIGYARVILTGVFFYYAFEQENYLFAITCYVASFSLDFFDGYFVLYGWQDETEVLFGSSPNDPASVPAFALKVNVFSSY